MIVTYYLHAVNMFRGRIELADSKLFTRLLLPWRTAELHTAGLGVLDGTLLSARNYITCAV